MALLECGEYRRAMCERRRSLFTAYFAWSCWFGGVVGGVGRERAGIGVGVGVG